jgi:hypothetical protein
MRSLLYLSLLTKHVIQTSAGVDSEQKVQPDIIDWIDPLIGSKNGGNVFAGATLPYGMAKGNRPCHCDLLRQLIPTKRSRMWTGRILGGSPQTIATSLVSRHCTTRELEATPAWGTFLSFHSYAQEMTSTRASFQSERERHTTRMIPLKHDQAILVLYSTMELRPI